MNDSIMGAGFTNYDPDTSVVAEKEKEQRMSSVMPCVIKQILNFTSEDFVIYGVKAQIVSIMGILRSYDLSTIKATYVIEDHTGQISATLWFDADADEQLTLPKVKEGRYVKVIGTVRKQDGEKTILVLKMLPGQSHNAVTTHLLEALHARYECQQLTMEESAINRKNNPSAVLANTMTHIYDDSAQEGGFSPMQKKVYEVISSVTGVDGMHINAVLNSFPANQHNEVKRIIEFLQSEGHIYTTIDPNHVRSTN